jgi:hypothetical protein
MSEVNLDLSNQLVDYFNSVPPKDGADKSWNKEIKTCCNTLFEHLESKSKGLDFQLNILNQAAADLAPKSKRQSFDIEAEKNPEVTKSTRPLDYIKKESLPYAQSNLSALQNLGMSKKIGFLKEEFLEYSKQYISPRVIDYQKGTESIPKLVQTIKDLENILIDLETALQHFEKMGKNESFIMQAGTLIMLHTKAMKAVDALSKLSERYQDIYAPVLDDLMEIKSILMNQEVPKARILTQQIPVLKVDDEPALVINDTYQPQQKKSGNLERKLTIEPEKSPTELRIGGALVKEEYDQSEQDQQSSIALSPAVMTNTFKKSLLQVRTSGAIANSLNFSSELDKLRTALIENNPQVFDASYQFVSVFETQKEIMSTGNNTPIKELAKQLFIIGKQIRELNQMGGQIIQKDYSAIKKQAYKDILIPIVKLENELGFKAGALVQPAMKLINNLFLTTALEIEMPFTEKMKLLDEKPFVDILVQQIELNIEAITDTTSDAQLQKNIIQDQFELFEGISSTLTTLQTVECKNLLLNGIVELTIWKQIQELELHNPVAVQYQTAMLQLYDKEKSEFVNMGTEEVEKSLQIFLEDSKKSIEVNYIIVDKASNLLRQLLERLDAESEQHQEIKLVKQELDNPDLSIAERSQKVMGLVENKQFKSTIESLNDGSGFWTAFVTLIESFKKFFKGGSVTNSGTMKNDLNQIVNELDVIKNTIGPPR